MKRRISFSLVSAMVSMVSVAAASSSAVVRAGTLKSTTLPLPLPSSLSSSSASASAAFCVGVGGVDGGVGVGRRLYLGRVLRSDCIDARRVPTRLMTTRNAWSSLSRSSWLAMMRSSLSSDEEGEWRGEVVNNADNTGIIRGCSIERQDGSMTAWVISIDGVEADLGRFSDAIYKKITSDAKRQRFQGFRPGTIPPHLVPTYVAFAMDECAREATLEAMEQNNVRPFVDARNDFSFDTISIPPPSNQKGARNKNKNKKRNSKKRGKMGAVSAVAAAANNDDAAGAESKESQIDGGAEEERKESVAPAWLTFETMKEAIDAGWKPGQSFSFVARNCKGQLIKDATGATPIGDPGYNPGSRVNWNAIDVSSESAT